jgi:predicted transcriptional regulator
VARRSWLDAKADHPLIQERADKLKTFTDAISDGVVTKAELAQQEERLVAAMKKAEPELNDAQHAKMTEVLVELTAYNVMRLLHELQAERVRAAFEKR